MIDFREIKINEMPEFKGGTGVTRAHMFVTDDIKIMNPLDFIREMEE